MMILLVSPLPTKAQEEEPVIPGITAPLAGEALQGYTIISGTTTVDALQSWELSFSYRDDTTDTWFLIYEGEQAIEDGTLTEWDTSTLTDGIYNLRLTIFLEDDDPVVIVVPDIRIRNYTSIETSTPTLTNTPDPAQATATPTASITPVPPTPTPLPTNPIEITSSDLSTGLTRGAIGAAITLLIVGLYVSIRNTLR
jgi:hypothetical protein